MTRRSVQNCRSAPRLRAPNARTERHQMGVAIRRRSAHVLVWRCCRPSAQNQEPRSFEDLGRRSPREAMNTAAEGRGVLDLRLCGQTLFPNDPVEIRVDPTGRGLDPSRLARRLRRQAAQESHYRRCGGVSLAIRVSTFPARRARLRRQSGTSETRLSSRARIAPAGRFHNVRSGSAQASRSTFPPAWQVHSGV